MCMYVCMYARARVRVCVRVGLMIHIEGNRHIAPTYLNILRDLPPCMCITKHVSGLLISLWVPPNSFFVRDKYVTSTGKRSHAGYVRACVCVCEGKSKKITKNRTCHTYGKLYFKHCV